MRRIILIATALGALAVAGVAVAATTAINTYTHTLRFTTKAAGTRSKPVPIGFTQNITAKGTNGNRTAVLVDLRTRVYGVMANTKGFPTCSATEIANAKTDAKCPKGALVASGYITAVLGPANNFTASGSPCTPLLHVWNSGGGKLTFFFVDTPTHQCVGLKTGQVGPYPATVRQQGKYMVLDVPIPSFVDYPLGPGAVAGSLEVEHLVWAKHTMKVKGRTVPLFASVGCMGRTRPYAETFKATLPSPNGGAGTTQTQTVTGKAPC